MTPRGIRELEEANAKLKKDLTTAVAMIEMLSQAVLKYRQFVLFNCLCDKQHLTAEDRFKKLAKAYQFLCEENRQEEVAENGEKRDGEELASEGDFFHEGMSCDGESVIGDSGNEEEMQDNGVDEPEILNPKTNEVSDEELSSGSETENSDWSEEISVEEQLPRRKSRRVAGETAPVELEAEEPQRMRINWESYRNDKHEEVETASGYWTKCLDCQRVFASFDEFKAHYKMTHEKLYGKDIHSDGKKLFQCLACLEEFKKCELLRKHYKMIHETGVFLCDWPDCEFSSKRKNNVFQHTKRHRKPDFNCDWPNCSRMFYTEEEVARHIQVYHKKAKNFKCNWPGCNHQTTSKRYLDKHLVKHTRERNYACNWPGCDKKYLYRSNLINHKLTHKGNRMYKCEVESCGKEYNTRGNLDYHYKVVHEGCREFKCEVPGCDMAFVNAANLRKHSIVHESEKNFKCEWPGCEFRAKDQSYVDVHAKRHKKPHLSCHWPGCGRMFYRDSEVKRHVETIHEQVKNFKCHWPSCEFQTSTNPILQTHLGFHTRERKWECSWPGCDKKYMCRSHLTRHVRERHKQKFKCQAEGCDKVFARREILNQHVIMTHEKEESNKE